jgi:hypothetical protein
MATSNTDFATSIAIVVLFIRLLLPRALLDARRLWHMMPFKSREESIPSMQATDFPDGDHLAQRWRLDRPPVRCIFGEGEVRSGAVVIAEVASQDLTQMALAEDDDVVETVVPDRADQAFGERILPRTLSGREDFLDPHALHALAEGVTVDGVSIAEEISGGGVGKRVHDLLSSPRRGGMLGDVEVQDPTPMVSEHDEDEEHPQLSGGDGEEVDRDQIPDMVREERPPGLRGRQRALRDQAGDRTFGNLDAKLEKLAMDSRCPQRGLAAAIVRTRAMISGLTDGRPTRRLREIIAQCFRNPRRCQRTTVSGVTTTRDWLHPAQTLVSPTQNRRSAARSRGRPIVRLYTATW